MRKLNDRGSAGAERTRIWETAPMFESVTNFSMLHDYVHIPSERKLWREVLSPSSSSSSVLARASFLTELYEIQLIDKRSMILSASHIHVHLDGCVWFVADQLKMLKSELFDISNALIKYAKLRECAWRVLQLLM